ncbi:hypothetical protein V8J82_07165 [Gymnodinialimonas sp. 2305UL16-5]|uniref:hypothetical protein n=1 Tax=Gymnodinialimonas mytili TaxID=3126503 RepID=UPI0030ACE502
MTTDRRLSDLRKVANVLADQALGPVTRAAAKVRKIETRIAEIAAHREALIKSASDPSVAATMLRQADRLRETQAQALTQLAAARAEWEKARHAAAQAVGRRQVLSELSKRRDVEEKRDALRRRLRGD